MDKVLGILRSERQAWARLFAAVFLLAIVAETVAYSVTANAHEGHTICYALAGVTDDGQDGEQSKTCPVCQTGACGSKVLLSTNFLGFAFSVTRTDRAVAPFVAATVQRNPATVLPVRGPPFLT